MQFKELYANFDGLDMAFHGRFSEKIFFALEAAKHEAQQARRDHLAMIGDLECHVAETGGRGGFGFRIDTGPDGEIWWIKKTDKDGWNCRVSVKSAAFLQYGGLDAIAARLGDKLVRLGWQGSASSEGHKEAVSRVDFAMDFLAPGLSLDPRGFVTKASKRDHHSDDPLDPDAHWMGSRCTGVTIGKMPGRQIVVYDKTRDAIQKRKDEWFSAWDIDKEDKGARVWRIEVRAGKKHLREQWGLRTLKDVQDAIGDVYLAALDNIRYCFLDNTNVTRRGIHPLWEQARDYLLRKVKDTFAGLMPGVIKEVTKQRAAKNISALMRGLSMTYAAIMGETAGSLELVPGLVAKDVGLWISTDPKECREKLEKAQARYRFITEADYWKRKEYAGIGAVAV